MTDIIFRQATHNDLPIILDLYTHFETDKKNKLSLEKAAKIFNKIKEYPNYTIYVAEANDKVIGSFALLIIDNLVHSGTPSAIIDAVIIEPEYQKQGIGKQMMTFAMQTSAEHGCYKLALSSNFKWGVHDFYQSLGFKQHGVSFYVELC